MSINGYLDVNLETSIGFIEAFPTPGRIIFSAYKAEGGSFSGDVTYSTLVEISTKVLYVTSPEKNSPSAL